MSVQCTTSLNNLSKTQCEATYGQIVAFWFDQSNTGVTTSDAETEAAWIAKIYAAASSRMFILNPGANLEAAREQGDAIFKEYNTGTRKKIRNGYLDFTFMYDGLTLCQANKLSGLNGLNLYAYAITAKNYIIAGGTSTQLQPTPVEIFVGDPVPPENNDGDWAVSVYLRYTNTENNFMNAIDPANMDFTPLDRDGIINIEFSSISADISDNAIIATIQTECDGADVDDLTTVGDIIARVKSTGVAITLASFTNVNDVWTITTGAGELTAVVHELLTKTANNATQKKYEYAVVAEFTPVA